MEHYKRKNYKMKKIIYLVNGYPDSKNKMKFIYLHEQIKEMNKNFSQVVVLDLGSEKNNVYEFYDGVEVYRFSLGSKYSFLKRFRLYYNLKTLYKQTLKSFDSIIIGYLHPFHFLYIGIFKTQKKILITHGVEIMLRWKKWSTRVRLKYVISKMDEFVAVSDATKIYLQHVVPKGKEKNIHVVYNGVNVRKLDNHMNTDLIINKYNIPSNKFVILTIGSLVTRKGVDILLQADILLKEKNLPYFHIIIGRGNEKENIEQIVKSAEISENILNIDYIEDEKELAAFYYIADVFALMSKEEFYPPGLEGFGIVYAEAQYAGLPVIGGKSGGVTSTVKDGFTGYLIDPDVINSHELVADKISLLVKNKDVYNYFSDNAKKFAKKKFSWFNYASKLMSYC